MDEGTAIRIGNLSKEFFRKKKKIHPLRNISLDIKQGETVALMGHNGAGKTTLLKILATLISPTEGSYWIKGFSYEKRMDIRKNIGLLTANERSFYWRLTGKQNLKFFGALLGLSGKTLKRRIEKVVEQFNISEYIDRRFDQYSAGMKQSLMLARLMLHEPRVLLLDEPTRSLDVEATQRFVDHLNNLKKDGQHTVFIATHKAYMARDLCERIVTLKDGSILTDQQEISMPIVSCKHTIITSVLSETEQRVLSGMPEVSDLTIHPEQSQSRILVSAQPGALRAVLNRALSFGLPIWSCHSQQIE